MTEHQRDLLTKLLKTYSASSTETLIGYLAATNGLLDACRSLLEDLDRRDSKTLAWLQQQCDRLGLPAQQFRTEIQTIVSLFTSHDDDEEPHQLLGVPLTASQEEIKRAYRKLSLKYHPDTATDPPQASDRFIKITKAYHALLGNRPEPLSPSRHKAPTPWRSTRKKQVSPAQRRTTFIWTAALLALIVAVSLIAANTYRKKTMLAGLQHSQGAFVPPARTATHEPPDPPAAAVTATTQPPVTPTQEQALQPVPPSSEPSQPVQAATVPPLVEKRVPADIPETPQEGPAEAAVTTSPATPAEPPSRASVYQSNRPTIEPPASQPETVLTTSAETAEQALHKKEPPAVTTPSQQELPRPSVEPQPPPVVAQARPVPETTHEQPAAPSPDVPSAPPAPLAPDSATAPATAGSPDMASDVAPPAPTEPESPATAEPPLQARLHSFFGAYLLAYSERNILSFSRFFTTDAVENNKPFATMVQTYLDLFQSTDHASLHLQELDWQETEQGVQVDGRFTVNLHYRDGHQVSGSGPIAFRLQERDASFLIETLNYHFEQ